MKPIKAIFVVGCPRSGTTLTGALIGSHSKAFWGNESGFLYALHVLWLPLLNNQPSPLAPLFSKEVMVFNRDLICRETEKRGKTIYVDDTPQHMFCIDKLCELFPRAYFVHVIRDGRAVCSSLHRSFKAGYEWAKETPAQRAELWKSYILEGEDNKKNRKWMEIRYEDLICRPIETTIALCDFVEVDYEKSMLNAFTVLHAGSTAIQSPIGYKHDNNVQFYQPPKLSWNPEEWNREDLNDFYKVGGSLLSKLGYE